MKRAILVLVATLLAALGMACLWDSDTLAQEMKGMPELEDIIAGRFDRFPPEYYEERLKRIEAGLGETTLSLGQYDDAAVACDRLNRFEEAIEWMHRKQEAMSRMKLSDQEQSEHQYRTHANLGTFLAHQALANKEPDLKLLKEGLAELEKGIAINPDAHFGRENVQIALIKDMIWELGDRSTPRPQIDITTKKMREGLIGLMVLGKAWESQKVWEWLLGSLREDDAHFAHLIQMRIKEINPSSKEPNLPAPLALPTRTIKDEDDATAHYHELRKSGKEWSKQRTEYITNEIKKGNHPDDNPKFWDGVKEVPRPEAKAASPPESLNNVGLLTAVLAGVTVAGIVLATRKLTK